MAFSKDSGTRKLAAVMFTDIKGFSMKMAQNETAAFELLRTHDALMRVIASKYEGKVVKSIGDSFMVDFASAVNAVKAAIDAQKRFWAFNKGKGEFDKIEIRIGIHLGDVMVSDDDMYGDGVNIASRIEAVTEATRICISADIYNQVKNKMDVKVYRMGDMQLKNIPEPVEVFEILIDSIPELSVPSESAQKVIARQSVEDTAELEAKEASTVEAAKKRGSTPVPQLQDTASQVEALYQKAEKLYNEGKIEEAERTIDEIAKIDPGYHAAVERKKEEDDKEKQVNEHYERAGTYLREGNFDLAENEVKMIFQMYPLHGGAQQLQLQIEEERYKKSEEERQQRLDQERKVREVKDRQVEDLTRRTEEHIEKDELEEAKETLKKIYALDPNFSAGERIEERLRRAETTKLEREHQKAFLEEQKQRESSAAQPQERQYERQQTKLPQKEEAAPVKINFRYIAWPLIIAVVLYLGYSEYPRIKRALIPPSASIAIMPLNGTEGDQGEAALARVMPAFLEQDLSRVDRVQVVTPSSAATRDADFSGIAAAYQVRYVLHGSVTKTENGFSISLQLFDNDQRSNVMSEKFDGDFSTLNRTRETIVGRVLDRTNMETSAPSVLSPTSSGRAYEEYLIGLSLVGEYSLSALSEADLHFQESSSIDSMFASAYTGRAEARIIRFKIEPSPGENVLREAHDFARKALELDPKDAAAFRDLAEIQLLTQRLDQVDDNIQNSLTLQPNDARCYGILAHLAVISGDYESAVNDALRAVKIQPDDPLLQVDLGIAQQFRGSATDAVTAFKRAITLGLSDSLITARYLLNAWSAQEDYDSPIQYFQKKLKEYPNDYRMYYWISRAFQMKPNINEFKGWSKNGQTLLGDYLDKHPNDAAAHAYLGLFLSREGMGSDGETEMKRAAALAPKSSQILFRQANLYAIQKKDSLAVAALRAALERDFNIAEILSPDFALIKNDTAFTSAITRKIPL
ncbi:MAG TPA: adenylate/guanylate cyclase domain-containing protein [Bacteroidota bacterium]